MTTVLGCTLEPFPSLGYLLMRVFYHSNKTCGKWDLNSQQAGRSLGIDPLRISRS